MKEFPFCVEVCLGFHCSGAGEYTWGDGTLKLEDGQVDQLVSLIRESGGETDLEELGLEEKYPDIYKALEEAYSEAASSATARHWLIAGFEGGYFDEPKGLMEKLEEDGLFKYEPEEDLEYAKDDAFCEWKDEYFESLSEDELYAFLLKYYSHVWDDCDMEPGEYEVEIPQAIVDLAVGKGA